jgi:D-glycero-D-manno-heptose 1,7-bisphosphate phosphatase
MIDQWRIDSTWSLFLDRDGVINERNWDGYILDFKDFVFKPNVVESLKFLTHFFSHTIIITNQQCVSKNLISVSELDEIHHQMLHEINANGGEITGIYAATEEKDKTPFRRKPNKTMGIEAQNQFPAIDFTKSIMVGDTDSDIQFGKNLGMKTILLKSAEINSIKADLEISSLTELVDYLMK